MLDAHRYEGLAALPAAERTRLETEVFRAPLDQVWADTERYFAERDPAQVTRARAEPKHQMALVFRWYLGKASRWAIEGTPDRVLDFQLWCGPSMGAFNDWVKGSFLEAPGARTVGQIALNLMEGAAVVTRASQLRTFGAAVPAETFDYRPVPLSID